MELQIQSIHFDADSKLLEYIQKKLKKLETFYDGIINGEVYLRLDKDNQKENKIVEIRLHVYQNSLFVKEQCKTFECATDLADASLRTQIIRFKERRRA